MTPVIQTQLTSTGDSEIKFGGVMKCVSYLKPGLAYQENKPAPATHRAGSALYQLVNTVLSAWSVLETVPYGCVCPHERLFR
jgi:hypothetical protein